ncbi:methyltransferase family protein [Paraburkholderia sp. RAU2J]|uniref:class I SAM-dependent methyltransferase n=1 Tax=Paraburkholderia sp. RAU2J TaxID=1938810 RepID=UPI000F10D471|nr:class I SAM-dependent methyltransferase [Paraburkholderia sp. RAU2J]RKT26194.1 methyltransferase family protein [Paraburkholderia sp. RAU2J]
MSTDKHWEKWGKTSPYYGVVSWPEFKEPELSTDAKQQFFEGGELYVSGMFNAIHRHLNPEFRADWAADFGCGVGRLIMPLSRRVKSAVGIDVSPSMLEEAARNVTREGIRNVEFVLSNDALTDLHGMFDLINSYIVFQHIPVERGMKLAEALLSHLSPGGIAVLHFTYDCNATRLTHTISWTRDHFAPAHWLANLARGRPMLEPTMQMNAYNVNRLLGLFRRCGIEKLHAEFTDHGAHGIQFFLLKAGAAQ